MPDYPCDVTRSSLHNVGVCLRSTPVLAPYILFVMVMYFAAIRALANVRQTERKEVRGCLCIDPPATHDVLRQKIHFVGREVVPLRVPKRSQGK